MRALAILCFIIFFGSPTKNSSDLDNEFIKGITMVAPPEAFNNDPFEPIQDVNANWVAFVPYAFTMNGSPNVRFGSKRQWWGERPEGIEACIKKAKKKGLNILLKPQVYIPGGWVGEMSFDSDSDWKQWESSYEKYIMTFVDIAIENDVEMICIGTEFKKAVVEREDYWRQLIKKIRFKYDGKLIYSANWDSFESVPFWDVLDFVGISSYFPLSESITPTVDELVKAWKPIKKKLKRFYQKTDKRIVFTEYGYLSVNQCAHRCWELERKIHSTQINEEAQANALEALYTVNFNSNYWAGGFLWKWFPNMRGHEGYPAKDYTPQGKISSETITEWYGKY